MMMQKTVRALVVLAVLALSTGVDAATRAPKVTNSSIELGDGTVVDSNSTTTVFLGTEYNPLRCSLQLASLQCNITNNNCGALNGYPLECVKLGRQNGKDKLQCQCRNNETDVCQRTTAPTTSGVPQFGDCTGGQQCVDSFGHVSTTLERRICAEKIHCLKEINTTATSPAEICHTCRSCIAQNDAANAKLSDKRRFDCTKVCPTEILESIAKRNKKGLGIADELSSDEESASGSSEEGSSNGTDEASPSTTKAPAASGTSSLVSVSASAVVGSIVMASLSIAVVH